jgi:iron complex transport system permease protein
VTVLAAGSAIAPSAERRQARRLSLTLAGLTLLLAAAVLASISIGPADIPVGHVVAIIGHQLGLGSLDTVTTRDAAIVEAIRLPRTLLGAMVGAVLAVSGAMMQGLFRNPLADPGLIGVSGGAAFAGVSVISLGLPAALAGLPFLRIYALPLAAFVGGLVATLAVYRLSKREGRVSVTMMLLGGIAVNALVATGTGYVVFKADENAMRTITFWTLGSLSGATWTSVLAVLPFALVLLAAVALAARALNGMLLGEAVALHLGFPVEKLTRLLVGTVALAVGAAVAVSGMIGFVGLLVPHMLRLVIGADHRGLLPATALLGAALLLGADLVARVAVAPAELPIGIVTTGLGAPVFLALLLRRRRSEP